MTCHMTEGLTAVCLPIKTDANQACSVQEPEVPGVCLRVCLFSGEHDGLKSESEALNGSKTVETRARRCGDSLSVLD